MAERKTLFISLTLLLLLVPLTAAEPVFSSAQPNSTAVADKQSNISVGISSENYSINESSIYVEINDTSGNVFNGSVNDTGVNFTETAQGGSEQESQKTLLVNPSEANFTMSEGLVNVSVEANDTAGNYSSTSWNFTVDSIAPEITGLNISNITMDDAELAFESDEDLESIYVRIEQVEPGDSSTTFWASLNRGDFTESSGTYSATFPLGGNGDYTAVIEDAQDAAGNEGANNQNFTINLYTENAALSNQYPNSSEANDTTQELSVDINTTSIPSNDNIRWTVEDSTGTIFEDTLANDGASFSNQELLLDPVAAGFEMENGDVTVTVESSFPNENSSDRDLLTWTFDMSDNTPVISDYNVVQISPDLVEIRFNSSEELSNILVDITESEDILVDESIFTTSDTSAPYGYVGEFEPSTEGNYTFRLDSATTPGGFEAEGGQTDSLIVTTPPSFSNATPNSTFVNNNQETLSVDINDSIGVDESSIVVEVNDSSGQVFTGGTASSGVSFSGNTLTVDPSTASFTMEEGEVNVSVDASDTTGKSDSVSWNFTVDTVAPSITNYNATNISDTEVEVTFTSDEQLEQILVDITGPETTSIDESDFTYSENSGSFNYIGIFTPGSSGDYTFSLSTAEDTTGNNGASGESETLTLDAPPRIDVFELVEENEDIIIRIESTKSLDIIEADLGGDISGSLTRSDFTESSTSPYIYETPILNGAEGYFNATLNTAQDPAGEEGASGQVAELDNTPPQNPSKTVIKTPIGTDNQSSVDISVSFDQPPVEGTLSIKTVDSEGTERVEEFSVNPDNAEQSVSVDLSNLPDGTVYAEAKLENKFGYVNPQGFTAESNTALKDTEIPQAVGGITGSSLSGDSNASNMVAIEYDDIGNIDPNTVSLNTFEIRDGSQPMDLAGYSIEDGYFLIELEKEISTDMNPVGAVDDGWADKAGNTQQNTVLFTVQDGLGPQLKNAVVDHERSDSDNTVVKLEFGEDIFNGGSLGIDGSSSNVETLDRTVYITYNGILNTGNNPSITGLNSVTDNEGNEASGDQTIKTMVKQFDQGWNTFSLPVETSQTYEISSILDTSKINTVWRYNNGEWDVYDPAASNQDFTSFEPGKGYLVDASESHKQGINVDTSSGSASLDVSEGWNLVAHMEEYNMTADNQGSFSSLSSVQNVETLNSNILSYGSADYAVPGEAYWVESGSTDTLTGSFSSQTSMGFFSWISSALNSIISSVTEVIF